MQGLAVTAPVEDLTHDGGRGGIDFPVGADTTALAVKLAVQVLRPSKSKARQPPASRFS